MKISFKVFHHGHAHFIISFVGLLRVAMAISASNGIIFYFIITAFLWWQSYLPQ